MRHLKEQYYHPRNNPFHLAAPLKITAAFPSPERGSRGTDGVKGKSAVHTQQEDSFIMANLIICSTRVGPQSLGRRRQ